MVKISLMAIELGVTTKTVYNWIALGKLVMPRPGYVNQIDAYEVWLKQKQDKSIFGQTMARHGITRDASGRFKTRTEQGE